MKSLFIMLCLVLSFGCSRKFKKDYDVVDASNKEIPEWIENPQEWADDEDEDDFKSYRYYVVNIDARKSREIACKIAKAQARSEVASEVTAFIKSTFGQSTNGDALNKDEELTEYIEDTLAQEVQSFVVGARVFREYWEKRNFSKEKGAQKDWSGYTCSALIKISKKNLEKAFKRAEDKLAGKVKQENKELVKKAVKAAQEEYLKL